MAVTTPVSSVVEIDVDDRATWWEWERASIRAALTDHFGRELTGESLTEPPDPASLRSQLRMAAPMLTAITDQIRNAFDGGACAVVVPALGVADEATDEQRKALFTLAALLGDVMANHPRDSVVWDVRNRAALSDARPKASDSDRAAGYHTDAGYLRMPPRYFLLYAAQAARCGGGVSLLRDGRILLDQLAETEQGRAAIRTLSEVVPRRVSESLKDVAFMADDGFQYSAVLGDKPMWRWSAGRTRPGSKRWAGKEPTSTVIKDSPHYSAEAIRQAIDTVAALLKHGRGEFRLTVPTDALLLVDNHIALHARTAFTDQERLLFRIRFHEITDG